MPNRPGGEGDESEEEGGKRRQPRRRPLPDEERDDLSIRLARERVDTHLPYESLPAAREHGLGYRNVSDLIASAHARGLVHLAVRADVNPYDRSTEVEQRLRRRFAHVRTPVVVAPAKFGAFDERDFPSNKCDPAHRKAARALAWAISHADFPLFQSGDVIGVGSGRGVWEFAQALRGSNPPQLATNVRLRALAGSIFNVHTEDNQNSLDANANATSLLQCFGGTKVVESVDYTIASPPDQIAENRKESPLGDAFASPTPSHAIVGVGVYGPGHRFYDEIADGRKTGHLDPIRATLQQLKDAVDDIIEMAPNYSPVADVCNRLFRTSPPPSASPELTLCLDRLEDLLRDINKLLINVTRAQLSTIPHIIVIAAGETKARALRDIVSKPLRLRRITLATTVATAEAMMNLEDVEGPVATRLARSSPANGEHP